MTHVVPVDGNKIFAVAIYLGGGPYLTSIRDARVELTACFFRYCYSVET
jgi:hypothetical protein